MEVDSERAKIHNALGQFANDWAKYWVYIVFDGWINVKGGPLTNILVVSTGTVIYLSTCDYSNHYNTSVNITKLLIKTIQGIGLYNVI